MDNHPAIPHGPQKKKRRIPAILRRLSPFLICWLIFALITGLRIYYTSVIGAKLKDLENIRFQETSAKDWREPHLDLTTLQPSYHRPRYYYTTPRPYYGGIRHFNNRRYYYTTPRPYYGGIRNFNNWRYYTTPPPYYGSPDYKFTTTSPNYNNLHNFQTSPSYFYNSKKRQTEPCPQGWFLFQSSCYMISSGKLVDQKTWDEARDDCRSRDAELVIVGTPEEQDFIYKSGLAGAEVSGYWIGLRVDGVGWKWVNGSEITNSYWLQQSEAKLHCATSVKEANGWKSVSCDEKKGWICQQKALNS